ncbi:MAG: MmcQ/YjbR family DNA-binding protein [Leptospiraceae bacterium]|nr:MmcQ/YjbR family DNA-binding protein [Leptospiraceae bacterium]
MAHPRKVEPDHPMIKKLREKCLALPETFEKEAWGEATFRVTKGSMFAMTDFNHHNSGHIAVWVKAAPLVQPELVERDPGAYFVPPYMGPKGWVGVKLNSKTRWKALEALLREAHLLSAPAKLRKILADTRL